MTLSFGMNLEVLNKNQIDPLKWDQFIKSSSQGSIYATSTYLNEICGDWDAIVISSGENWDAVFPYQTSHKLGFCSILQVKLCQYWGVILRPTESKISKEFEFKKKCISAIAVHLSQAAHRISINCAPELDYLLPFYWSGFSLVPRFTYRIRLSPDSDEVYSQFSEYCRRDIRKAEKSGIRTKKGEDFAEVIDIYKRSLGNRLKTLSNSQYTALLQVCLKLAEDRSSYTYLAMHDGQAVAGIIFFKYKELSIYFFGSTLPEFKQSGAMSLIIWESVKEACTISQWYDFEGSMIESIERFFRNFGASPFTYMNISKYGFPFQQMNALRSMTGLSTQ